MTITIVGFSSDDKVPGFYGETKYGQGRVSIGSLPVFLTVMGGKISAGSATVATVYDVLGEDEADDLFGAGSELARMCYAALSIPGINLRAIAVAEAGGATAATLTATFGGTWTEDGEVSVRLAGKTFTITVGASDSTSDLATRLADKLNEDPRMPASAGDAGAVTTLTTKSKSSRQNEHLVAKDLSNAPSGLTLTLAGGTALTGGITPFTSGAGADDVTNALAAMEAQTHDYIAPAEADATNADLVRDFVNAQAGPLVGRLQHFVMASARTSATAVSLSQTTLNEYRGQVVWLENSEIVASEIAAVMGALRAATEGSNPNPDYDDVELTWLAPQAETADRPSHAALKSALNNGVTPLKTTDDGRVQVVRAITSHSLNGAAPDYRTLDVGDAVVPDRIRKECAAYWSGEFKVANPYIGPDPGEGERAAPAGVATPALWTAAVISEVLRPAEAALWVADVDSNLPVSEYDSGAKRIMSAVPVVVRPIQHQIGVSVRQQAA